MAIFLTLGLCGLALLLLASQAGLFHTCGYFKSLGNTADTDAPAIADDIIPISNTHFLPYRDYDLIAAYASAVTLTRAKLKSGTIAQINPTYIRPINAALLPATNPNIMLLQRIPFKVHKQEELQLLLTDSAAGPNNAYGLLWLQSQYQAAPSGPIWNVRFTSTSTAAAQAWTTLAITLETGLPAGKYAVVGLEVQSTNIIAARMIFDNQVERPGVIGISALANRQNYELMYGGLGLWGYFFTYSLPRVQVLCDAADASFEGIIEVIPVGPSI